MQAKEANEDKEKEKARANVEKARADAARADASRKILVVGVGTGCWRERPGIARSFVRQSSSIMAAEQLAMHQSALDSQFLQKDLETFASALKGVWAESEPYPRSISTSVQDG